RLARDLLTLEGEEQYDGEQQPVQGPWSDLWDEFLLVPVSPLALLTDPPRGEPSDQGHSEEDEDIESDLTHRDLEPMCVQAEPARQDAEVEPAEDGEHDDLEDRVDRHQHRGRLAVAAGQVVPDHDHGDATGQTDDDEPGAVLGKVGQENPGQGE